MIHKITSEFIKHIAREHCGSSDANALYTDEQIKNTEQLLGWKWEEA